VISLSVRSRRASRACQCRSRSASKARRVRRRRSSGQVRSHGFTSWARGARIVSQRRGRLCAVAHTTAPGAPQRSPRCISRRCNRGEEWTGP
jgi:hypothetical protein